MSERSNLVARRRAASSGGGAQGRVGARAAAAAGCSCSAAGSCGEGGARPGRRLAVLIHLEAGERQRRVPVRLDLRVDVRSSLQEHTSGVPMPVHRRQHQRRDAQLQWGRIL